MQSAFDERLLSVKSRVSGVIQQYKSELALARQEYDELETKYNDAKSLMGMLCKESAISQSPERKLRARNSDAEHVRTSTEVADIIENKND